MVPLIDTVCNTCGAKNHEVVGCKETYQEPLLSGCYCCYSKVSLNSMTSL